MDSATILKLVQNRQSHFDDSITVLWGGAMSQLTTKRLMAEAIIGHGNFPMAPLNSRER